VDRVWFIEPEQRVVRVYDSPEHFVRLRDGDILHGEGVLEGFELPVTELFGP
jgi:hypothetical protein